MDKLKKEFVRAIMISLKIEDNPFIIATIDEFTKHIKPTEYKSFMAALFGSQHAYLNGIDRVSKVAETYKEVILEVDETEQKAKHLITAVEQMNSILCTEAHAKDMTLDDYVRDYEFTTVCDETMTILNNVKPHYNLRELVKKIRQYQTSIDTLSAFKQAIKQHEGGQTMIENKSIKQLQIKKG